MDFLVRGYKGFKEGYYKNNKELFEGLSEGQNPKALFITCVDSRINPSLIFNTNPGDMLTLRIPGNIVHPYDEDRDASVSATVEFAIFKLGIRRVFICGHSDCGAIRALFKERDFFNNSPKLLKWVELNSNIKEIVKQVTIENSEDFFRKVEYKNIINSINNLKSYPYLKRMVLENELKIKGLYFDIGKGDVLIFEEDKEDFFPLI